MRKWHPDRVETVFRHPLFELQDQRLRSGDDQRQAVVLKTPDWVNVIPLLDDDRVLLVRQWRYGIQGPTLEIPGGVVEEEDALEAGRRELREETGYEAQSWRHLGTLHPNPAIQSNRVLTYVATDLTRLDDTPRGDGDEELEVEIVALADVPQRIAAGQITHSLVVAAFHLLSLRSP